MIGKVCSTWKVQYTDARKGEDVWPYNYLADVPASHAWVAVTDGQPIGTWYWYGNNDESGCTPYLDLPASTELSEIIWADWVTYDWTMPEPRVWFDNWLGCSDDGYPSAQGTSFITPPGGEGEILYVNHQINDQAVQTAAITGLILKTNDEWRHAEPFDQLVHEGH
jgi:hypothetical protein